MNRQPIILNKIILIFLCLFFIASSAFSQHTHQKTINVNKHHIYGNDTTDDSYALRQLINSRTDTFSLYFPKGVYVFSNIGEDTSVGTIKKPGSAPQLIIRLKSNISLIGDGQNQTIFLIKGQTNSDKLQPTDFAEFWVYPGSSNINLQNITIKGDIDTTEYKYNGTTQNSALYFYYSKGKTFTSNCSISNCSFENLVGFAANGDCRNFTFSNNNIRYTGNGVNVQSLRDAKGFVNYTGNSFYHCEGIESASSNLVISNNTFIDAYAPISAGGMTSRTGISKNITISDNVITGTKTYSAIIIQSGVSGCLVSKNIIRNSYIGAITVAPWKGKDKTGNYIVSVDSVTFINNTIVNTTTANRPSTYAFDINSYCYNITIQENNISYDPLQAKFKTGGIVVNPGSSVHILNNSIQVNYGKAISESSVIGSFDYHLKGNNLNKKSMFVPHSKEE